ncbi:MAG: hypothetical protein PWP72_1808 [Thermoanaerobacter sp.]|jgi:predicted transcriptional regulator|nr:hypothetical protein [Thermoanaerobacter sp.]MDN5365237.1 hypothetical protein [Thermacetogenium sp.]
MPASVRISSRAWKTLKEIAEHTGETMYAVLDRAVEAYRRQWLLQKTNEAYAALKGNPEGWRDETAERREWDSVLSDGLEGGD